MRQKPDHDGAQQMQLRFWGTRGSLACPGPAMVVYGGNTSCVEISCGEQLFIFDAGTGIRPLGNDLLQRQAQQGDLGVIHLFLSHTHLDHIVGLPFFAPLYHAQQQVRVWAGHLLPDHSLGQALADMMAPPLFPVPPAIFQAQVDFTDFRAGESLQPSPDVTIKTALLNHPNGATGYRLEWGGRAICYVTDTEHLPGKPDQAILGLIQDADILIYDSSYTDEEFLQFQGYGHSTWQEALRLGAAANVGQVLLFHHDPLHDDSMMAMIEAAAQQMRPGSLAAREGMVITLNRQA